MCQLWKLLRINKRDSRHNPGLLGKMRDGELLGTVHNAVHVRLRTLGGGGGGR